ncbi:hypothetical protein GGQ74_001163 [Desulfobaculum xiamenense]|uniref:Uncharacterized protein n=1 Tax=Desulfobaculum xiamenense TaxID=995050 RepID=A0A846QMQ4_9BACT|nr:hypothetical protein [Desulfobaculum xiamenense]NJB67523.1 hypothetical protein [Desulfobaculum xiamenense]
MEPIARGMDPAEVRRRYPLACKYCCANRPYFGDCFGEVIDGCCEWDEEGIRARMQVIRLREAESGRKGRRT